MAAVAAGGVVVALGLNASVAQAAVTTLYVGTTNCSDAGPGSAGQPFCTLAKAAGVATAGQTVQVASGTYAGGGSVKHSGLAGSPITFTAAPGATVNVQSGTNGFAISGKSYIVINGFSITGTTSYGISVKTSSNITLTGNTVTFSGTQSSSGKASGVYLSRVTSSLVSGNTSDHNSDHGFYLTGGTTTTTISHNEASFNAEGYQRNANGINVISPGNTIIGNVLHDNEDSGLNFYPGGNNNLATLNVSYNNGDHGIDDLNVTGGRIIGNTIYHNCTTGINVEGTSGNYTVENNVAVDNAVYPAYKGIKCSRRDGNIGIWDSAPATTTLNHNLVYLTTAGTMEVFGTKFTSQAALTAATGQEQYGVQGDPRFVAAGSGNLQLLGTSPAIDKATSAAPGEQSVDILGNPRVDVTNVSNTPDGGPRPYDDMGAYEYQPGSGPQPQAPTAALTVSPSSGTAPLPVTADASGSTDPQNETMSYSFNFGDGTTVGPQAQATATHTYSSPGTFTVTVTATDTSGLSGTATAPVTATAPTTNTPKYVSQIASNYSTSTHTSGYITVYRTTGVAAGDTAVITVELTGTSTAGAVSGTDTQGNSYTVAADVGSGSSRLVVLSGTVGTALVPNDKITISFPSAATYRITGDELSGVTGVDRTSTGSGNGTTFSSGATATTSTPKELVFASVLMDGSTAPTWAGGWTSLTSYANGAFYLGRAYQAPTSTGSFTGSGTGSGNWLATVVTFD